jgi:hypothetical protein
MPTINLPLVKFERDAGGFICPRCKAKFPTHPEFVTHFSTEHAPNIGVRRHDPVFTPALTPQAVGGQQVTCPICQRRFLGSDYAAHAVLHAGGGITASQFNQEQPR